MAVEWQDKGLILSARPHGEAHAVLSLLTEAHGRHAGLVPGGQGRRMAATVQAGNLVDALWRARLADQLGSFRLELAEQSSATLFDRPGRLAALLSACALLDLCLPEREPHPVLFTRTLAFVRGLSERDDWGAFYVLFELALLTDLGFALDVSHCAVTGRTDGLVYVSPRTGRAVSEAGAGVYADRLLKLPPFLTADRPATASDVLDGLRLTAHFLRRHMLDPVDRSLPDARERLVAIIGPETKDAPPPATGTGGEAGR